MKSKLDYAKEYVFLGYNIFPCKENGKQPLTMNGYKDASSNIDDIEAWWEAYPNANIGLPTGRENELIVLDVDVKNDADGIQSLNDLMVETGLFNSKAASTPSGGWHYYFNYPKGFDAIKNRVNMRPGIDIRADGGYVIAPGSVIDEDEYKFADNDNKIVDMSEKLLEVITGESKVKIPEKNLDSSIKEGERNDQIFKLASRLRGEDVAFNIAEKEIIATASACTPPLPETEAIRTLQSAYDLYEPNPKNPTDAGNAERMIGLFGDDIHYVYEFKKWVYWNGSRWMFDEDGYIMRLAKETARSIVKEVSAESDDYRRRELLKHAMNSEKRQQLESMVQVAKTEQGVTISQSELDKDKYLLGVANGVINLKTGGFIDNAKDKMITKQSGTTYDHGAKCPRWVQFVEEITNNDKELVEYLQKIVGYSLTGSTKEQILFFLYGHGANGKSVFVNTVQDLLGDYAMQTPVSSIMTRGKGSVNNDIARLRGATFVATTETEEGSKFNESEVKLLTGGDVITARHLHQEFFQYRPMFKLWISGNHKPVPGDGYGIWRRLMLIPFNVRFDKEHQDKELSSKLKAELPGILNWAIEGCLKWQDEGLSIPKVIQDATKEYKSEMDRINSWMQECCIENPGDNQCERASDLYQSYKSWAKDTGEWEMNQRIFGTKLTDRGLVRKRNSRGMAYYGIKLDPRLASNF